MIKNKIRKSISIILVFTLISVLVFFSTTNLNTANGENITKLPSALTSELEEDQENITKSNLLGDINGDGFVDSKDYVKLFQYLNCHPFGDLNDDGKVDTEDAQLLYQYIRGNATFSDKQYLCADVNGDGLVDARDYMKLYRTSVGLDNFTQGQLQNTDLNGDGKIDKFDLNILRDILQKLMCRPLGDVNGDGSVDAQDVQMVMDIYTGKKITAVRDKICADVNGDGKVTTTDAQIILNIINGLYNPDQ